MAVDDALPWTTSRCNRLLRPLSSKLAKLRREHERPHSSGDKSRSVSSAFATKGSPLKTTNFTRPAHKPRGFDRARDPDWRPGSRPGASKKTYGGRGGIKMGESRQSSSNSGDMSRPGEIAFTPLIARMSERPLSSPQFQASPIPKLSNNRGPLLANVEHLQAKHIPADLQKVVQGLSEAYANLLQATTLGDEKRWKGTRSLMGACLRRLPAYIELEEHFSKMDKLEEEGDFEDREVANEIYEDLETRFEQRAGHGWRPFRQVVRAHGTSLLCNAVTDEVLGLECLSVLLAHCLNVWAWDEAERLLIAYMPLLKPFPMPINIKANLFDAQQQPYLTMFKRFTDRTGRHGLLYDLLEHTIALELLPLEWLATECMRPLWDRLVRFISDNHRSLPNAYRFMETATIAGMGLTERRLLENQVPGSVTRRFVPSSRGELRNALNTTYSSLLTVLCSIALINDNRDDPRGRSHTNRFAWVLDATAVALSMREDDIANEMKLLNPDTDDAQIFAQRALSVHFASFLIHLEHCIKDRTMLELDTSTSISHINRTANAYQIKDVNIALVLGTFPALISSVARGTGRIWKDDGFEQLQRFVTGLTTKSGCRLPHKLWTLKRLALESTIEFAHSTGDAEHMTYARAVENKMRTQGRLVIQQSPEKNDSSSSSGGFRWEEGIGEWVACTPFARQAVKRQPSGPVRALQLLPTPVQSDDEKADSEDGSETNEMPDASNSPIWIEDREDTFPTSSQIKSTSRRSTSSLGKRRVFSPMVVIPAKRVQMTPPDIHLVTFYPTLAPDKQDGSVPRRSIRPKQSNSMQALPLRTQRSRASLAGGLRVVKRLSYVEPSLDPNDDSNASTSDQSDTDTDASSASVASPARTRASRPTSALSRQSRRLQQALHTTDCDDDDVGASEHDDELSKTPAQARATAKYAIVKQTRPTRRGREWWKVHNKGIIDSEASEAGDDDELSFH